MPGRILVGTSSWADPGFVKEWYPQGMDANERLPWYAQRFRAVELNSSFYAIPDRNLVHRWAEVTPDEFTFDVKVHRALSRHQAPLDSLPPDMRDEAETNERGRVILTPDLEIALAKRLVEEVTPLEEAGKMGAFLVQLTPAFSPGRHELGELEALVEALRPHKLALELRNRNWVEGDRLQTTMDWYADHGVAFVGVDAPPGDNFQIMPPVDAATRDDLAYLRMHGRNTDGYLSGRSVSERFGWKYDDAELEEIAGRARELAERSSDVHVMFNNNRGDDAPTAAQRFQALIGQDPGPPPEDPQLQLDA